MCQWNAPAPPSQLGRCPHCLEGGRICVLEAFLLASDLCKVMPYKSANVQKLKKHFIPTNFH